MALTPATNRQVPEHAILDFYNKQTYLGNQFVLPLGTMAIASTSETPLILFQAGSTLAIPVQGKPSAMFFASRTLTCLTASQTAIFNLYANPTFSDIGTPVTPINARLISPTTSFATVSTGPTVSSNGTLLEQLSVTAFSTALSQLMFIADLGQSVLLTVKCSANPTIIAGQIVWNEM